MQTIAIRKPRVQRTVVSISISLDEYEMIRTAADGKRVTISTFFREATTKAARRLVAGAKKSFPNDSAASPAA